MSAEFDRLRAVVAELRSPAGCPWDREQTNLSLLPALLEEAYEVVSAVRAQDDANLREELGDLLLLIVMQVQIAAETGRLQLEEVIDGITQKLIRRHPHVFAQSDAADSASVLRQWERIKMDEKKGSAAGYLDDLPQALPALMRAQKAQAKAARVNFDWREAGEVMAKVEEEFDETKAALAEGAPAQIEEEIGDLFFAVVNLARKNNLDAEATLQAATDKFVRRFGAMESALATEGKKLGEVDLATLDLIWNRMKSAPPVAV